MAGVKPADIDVASIYDDYPTMVLAQLNDLGMIPGQRHRAFCRDRDRGAQVADQHLGRHAVARASRAATPAGMNGISEAVLQLQGRADERQVKDARACGRHRLRHDDVSLRRHGGRGSPGARRMSEGVTIWRCAKCRTGFFPEPLLCPRCHGASIRDGSRHGRRGRGDLGHPPHARPGELAAAADCQRAHVRRPAHDGRLARRIRAGREDRTVPGRRGAVRAREGDLSDERIRLSAVSAAARHLEDRRTHAARAHRSAHQEQSAGAGHVRELGADAQRAVPRHHDGRPGHPGALHAAAGGRADAGHDRGGQCAACRHVGRAKEGVGLSRSIPISGGAGRTPSFISKTTACASTKSAQPLRDAVMAVLRASMSSRGYELSRDVMRLNRFLGDLVGGPEVMGEWSFTFCLFGAPSASEPWGWQLFGHHLVLSCFVLGEQMVLTPAFWGAEPNYADHGPFKGIHLFQDEERAGLTLMRSFIGRAAEPRDRPPFDDGRRSAGGAAAFRRQPASRRCVPGQPRGALRGAAGHGADRLAAAQPSRPRAELSVGAAGRSARRAHGRGRAAHGGDSFLLDRRLQRGKPVLLPRAEPGDVHRVRPPCRRVPDQSRARQISRAHHRAHAERQRLRLRSAAPALQDVAAPPA